MSATVLAEAALPLLLDAALKGTAVLLAAFVLACLMRRASAGSRHLLWALTMIGLLVVPVVSSLLPAWQLPVALPWPGAGLASGEITVGASNVVLVVDEPVKHAPAAADIAGLHGRPVLMASRDATLPGGIGVEETPARAAAPVDWAPTWVAGVWLAGVFLVVAWLVGGWLSLGRLTRSCQAVREGTLWQELTQLAREMGIRRSVQLLVNSRRAIPMTWGLVQPIVLLPKQAVDWNADRLRMVLIHELAHIQRCDCLVQMLGHLARGLYWYHPLAWLALRQLRIEQEQAADDVVLERGASAPDYAEHLLAVTTGLGTNLWTAPVALAIGMGRAARLRRRLSGLLDEARNHRPVHRRALALAVAVALAFTVPLGTAILVPTSATAQDAKAKDQAKQPASDKDSALLTKLSEVQQILAKHYVTPVDEKSLADSALKGLLQGLNDPYTVYLSPDEMTAVDSQLKGALTGIGAQLQLVDGRLTVTTPLEGSPALKAGLRPGDLIEAIDGKSTYGLKLAEAVRRILGPAGAEIKLKVVHADGVVNDLAVTRAEIRFSSVNGFQRGADGNWQYLLDAEHKVGYLRVQQFAGRTAEEMRLTIQELQKTGLKGLIVDLRFCPGGLLEQAVATCKLFLAKGTILSQRAERARRKRPGRPTARTPWATSRCLCW